MTRTFQRIRRSRASWRVGASLVAQTAVPEIAFDTNADLLQDAATTCSSAKSAASAPNSKGQIFVYTRTGHPYATLGDNRTFSRGGSRLFQFDQTGKFVRELGQDVYGFNAAIGLRVDPQDNVWTIDAAANQVVKFDTEGRVALVLGRKPETIAVRPARPAAVAAVRRRPRRCSGGAMTRRAGRSAGGGAPRPRCRRGAGAGGGGGRAVAAAARLASRIRHAGIGLQPSDRRRLGSRRQHLHRRRHRQQQPRREVRQGRPVHQALGLDRLRPGPVQRREGARDRRAGQRLRRRRRQQADPGVRRATAPSSRSSATSARR